MFITLLTIVHVFVCIMLVAIVLLQQGKGADMGATFGGGGQTLFGASGADTLLTKVTTGTALLFMVTSVLLAIDAKKFGTSEGRLFQEAPPAAASAPVTKGDAPKAPASEESAAAENTQPAAQRPLAEQAAGTQPVEATQTVPAPPSEAPVAAAPEAAQPSGATPEVPAEGEAAVP